MSSLFVTHAKTGQLTEEKAGHVLIYDLDYHSKHVKGTINHQLQKFTPLGPVSYVAVIYFAPHRKRKQRRVIMPLRLFLSLFKLLCYCEKPHLKIN